MQKFIKLSAILTTMLFATNSCGGLLSFPGTANFERDISHMQEYDFKDQTPKNEKIKNQAFGDLTGCMLLVDIRRWKLGEYKWGKDDWTRHQSWQYPNSTMVSEEHTGINDETYTYPKDTHIVYIGPWKDINLEYGPFWNKTKINRKIRFTATQKKSDLRTGYVYARYEFMTPLNKNIPEKQNISLAKELPAPEFKSLCEVKWIAKFGYNAILDRKTGKIIEAKE